MPLTRKQVKELSGILTESVDNYLHKPKRFTKKDKEAIKVTANLLYTKIKKKIPKNVVFVSCPFVLTLTSIFATYLCRHPEKISKFRRIVKSKRFSKNRISKEIGAATLKCIQGMGVKYKKINGAKLVLDEKILIGMSTYYRENVHNYIRIDQKLIPSSIVHHEAGNKLSGFYNAMSNSLLNSTYSRWAFSTNDYKKLHNLLFDDKFNMFFANMINQAENRVYPKVRPLANHIHFRWKLYGCNAFYSKIINYYTKNVPNGKIPPLNDIYHHLSDKLFFAHCGFFVVSEYHKKVSFDEFYRLHSENEPAIQWINKNGIYAMHGVNVPQWFIKNPEKITLKNIEDENNVEIRRILINKYGLGRFLEDSGAKLIDKSEFGELYKRTMRNSQPIVIVRVINSTPEEDGSRKEYFLRVPPRCKTALEAVAWTFHLTPQEYKPTQQT